MKGPRSRAPQTPCAQIKDQGREAEEEEREEDNKEEAEGRERPSEEYASATTSRMKLRAFLESEENEERQRGSKDEKEEKQYGPGKDEEHGQDTRGVHQEESPQNRRESIPEKSEGEDEQRTPSSPETQAGRTKTSHPPKMTSVMTEREALQPYKRWPEKAKRGLSLHHCMIVVFIGFMTLNLARRPVFRPVTPRHHQ